MLTPRQLMICARCGLLLSVLLIASRAARGQTVVNFPDSNLEAAVRNAIGKPTGDIYDTDLVGVGFTYLDASSRGIADLTGLDYCTDLTQLALNYDQISDISAVGGLTNLTYLSLRGNQISDISPVSGLTDLTGINLFNNQVSDISPVSGLTNLTELILYNNRVSDLGALVNNAGLGTDDTVVIMRNPLSQDTLCNDIPTLEGRGFSLLSYTGTCGADADGDDLADEYETLIGTYPDNADSDADGLDDAEEVRTHRTDPMDDDSDSDGYTDGDEVLVHGTDPLDPDSYPGSDEGVPAAGILVLMLTAIATCLAGAVPLRRR